MGILIGSTGFVGGHLRDSHNFDIQVHRSDVEKITDLTTDVLVCAGLPAEKWRANTDPDADWTNMAKLAQVLTTVTAQRGILISTVDVFQPANCVDELTPPHFDGADAYGSHRAWFEIFFKSRFPQVHLLRLPGLYAPNVRKNLIHDLLHGKEEQWKRVNPISTFQFFDVRRTWTLIERVIDEGIDLLNISSEPVTAQDVAGLFGVHLNSDTDPITYDMRSIHAEKFGGRNGYIFNRETILEEISLIREVFRS